MNFQTLIIQAISDVSGGVDDLTDGFDDANGAAKELKRTILGFDQLNIMSKPTTSGGGSVGSGGIGGDLGLNLPEYDFLGGLIETKTKQIVDNILGFFKKVSDSPFVKRMLETFDRLKPLLSDIYENSKNILGNIGDFLADIMDSGGWDFFESVWASVDNVLDAVSNFFDLYRRLIAYLYSNDIEIAISPQNIGDQFKLLGETIELVTSALADLTSGNWKSAAGKGVLAAYSLFPKSVKNNVG